MPRRPASLPAEEDVVQERAEPLAPSRKLTRPAPQAGAVSGGSRLRSATSTLSINIRLSSSSLPSARGWWFPGWLRTRIVHASFLVLGWGEVAARVTRTREQHNSEE